MKIFVGCTLYPPLIPTSLSLWSLPHLHPLPLYNVPVAPKLFAVHCSLLIAHCFHPFRKSIPKYLHLHLHLQFIIHTTQYNSTQLAQLAQLPKRRTFIHRTSSLNPHFRSALLWPCHIIPCHAMIHPMLAILMLMLQHLDMPNDW